MGQVVTLAMDVVATNVHALEGLSTGLQEHAKPMQDAQNCLGALVTQLDVVPGVDSSRGAKS